MRASERSRTCLIASKSRKTADSLTSILKQSGFSRVIVTGSGSKARNITAIHDVDLILINTPLEDDFGTTLAMDMADKSMAVILLVKREDVDRISYRMQPYGAVTLGKPLVKAEFIRVLDIVSAMMNKIHRLDRQQKTLEIHVKEMKLITRAKCLLIQQLAMSENEAHRYMEKTAMNTGRKMVKVAEDIISTYEN